MKEIAELTESEFDRVMAGPGLPLLVDFYAPWSEPCKMIAPLLEQLAHHFAGRLEITGVPTLLMIHEGAVSDGVVGFPSPRELMERLERLAAHTSAAPIQEVRS